MPPDVGTPGVSRHERSLQMSPYRGVSCNTSCSPATSLEGRRRAGCSGPCLSAPSTGGVGGAAVTPGVGPGEPGRLQWPISQGRPGVERLRASGDPAGGCGRRPSRPRPSPASAGPPPTRRAPGPKGHGSSLGASPSCRAGRHQLVARSTTEEERVWGIWGPQRAATGTPSGHHALVTGTGTPRRRQPPAPSVGPAPRRPA